MNKQSIYTAGERRKGYTYIMFTFVCAMATGAYSILLGFGAGLFQIDLLFFEDVQYLFFGCCVVLLG